MTKQRAIPCVLMRGGTSKAPFFKLGDLPQKEERRDAILLAAMGSPDPLQINGVGGAQAVTSKVAMISPSPVEGVDVDYLFAQVSIDQGVVDTSPSCGNILSGVGPFAIEEGLVMPKDGETMVRIRNVNTDSRIDAVIQTPDGQVEYDGEASIDGVPGTAAPIMLRFMGVDGSKTGAILPTGKVKEEINGIEVTCLDVAVPMVMMRATDFGLKGNETKAELDGNADLLEKIEAIRRIAGERMGLGDVTNKVIPKIGLLSQPTQGGAITSRYFVPQNCHPTHAVTGAQCVAVCAVMKGSIAEGFSQVERRDVENIIIEHPSGKIDVELSVTGHNTDMRFNYAGILRTARRLFQGEVLVSEDIWSKH
ncbi:4-oxalomesaconate tautomerase [Terasakiella sp. SH-1]|uniref:4-oxalomesaconate tautomerase n=1 Tax=Terasakiella sp. SH-1 TaxID=2560057 RepID=UPI00107462BA|nr:4-oxalomesaconate tautomerase [Terasakiella sp. SH-1]